MKESVSLANMRLSAVDGTAFVDVGVADLLTDNIGEKLYIRDSAGATIWGWIKAAGTGETLGSELITNGDFASACGTGWTCDGDWDISGGEATTGGGTSLTQAWAKSAGTLFLSSCNYISLAASAGLWISGAVSYYPAGFNSTTGTRQGYFSKPDANTFFGVYASGATVIDDISIKQVLTPSTTGVTIVSTEGGTTYNWASKDAGFDYNDASGYEISTSRLGHNPFYGPMC